MSFKYDGIFQDSEYLMHISYLSDPFDVPKYTDTVNGFIIIFNLHKINNFWKKNIFSLLKRIIKDANLWTWKDYVERAAHTHTHMLIIFNGLIRSTIFSFFWYGWNAVRNKNTFVATQVHFLQLDDSFLPSYICSNVLDVPLPFGWRHNPLGTRG